MLKTGLLFSLLTLATSCAYHVGNISTGSNIDCPLRYIATGTSKTVKVLGMGGLDKDALILEAKQNLYSKFPYSKTTKLSNFAVDYKFSFFFITSSTKVTVSADVYDCDSLSIAERGNVPEDLNMTIGGFKKGDSVLYESEKYYKGVFLKYTKSGKYEVKYSDGGATFTKELKPSSVYKTAKDEYNKTHFGFDVGEQAYIEVLNKDTAAKTKKPCTIVGINATSAVILYTKEDGTPRTTSVKKSALKK